MSELLIFAIDPGTIDSGIAFARDGKLVETKTLHVPKSWKALDRILAMMTKMDEHSTDHFNRPWQLHSEVHIPYEDPMTFTGSGGFQYGQDYSTARPIVSLYQMVALIEYWAHQKGFKTFPYNVNDIKEGVAGRPNATKQEVEFIMRQEWNLHEIEKSNHEFDAISVLTFHLRQLAIQAAIIP